MGTRAAILSQFFMQRSPVPSLPPRSPTSTARDSTEVKLLDSNATKEEEGEGVFNAPELESYDALDVKHRYLPIISGLICPFAVLLDIPSLTERWYIKLSADGVTVVGTRPNPILLDVGLGVSIFLGLMANAALIRRFSEKNVRMATWTAIIALFLHDIINIASIIVFALVHKDEPGSYSLDDSFWMCAGSTVCSLVCSITLLVDLLKTKDFVKNGSGLTMKQRSLVVAVMGLLCYIGFGSLCYAYLIKDLIYINSVYFTIVTISTVGFGDIVPTTTGARVFSFFYDTAGIILLAYTISIARETVMETFETSYHRRRQLLAERAKTRKEEKLRLETARRERLDREMREDPVGFLERQRAAALKINTAGSRFRMSSKAQREADFIYEKEHGVTAGKAWNRRLLRAIGAMATFEPPLEDGLELKRTITEESLVADTKYKDFQKKVQEEQNREFRLKLFVAVTLFVSFWLFGSTVLHFTEGWTFFEAMYFCYIFFTTIGYGDLYPRSQAGRAFFVTWSILGIATMTLLLSVVTEIYSARYHPSSGETNPQQSSPLLPGTNDSPETDSDLSVPPTPDIQQSLPTRDECLEEIQTLKNTIQMLTDELKGVRASQTRRLKGDEVTLVSSASDSPTFARTRRRSTLTFVEPPLGRLSESGSGLECRGTSDTVVGL